MNSSSIILFHYTMYQTFFGIKELKHIFSGKWQQFEDVSYISGS